MTQDTGTDTTSQPADAPRAPAAPAQQTTGDTPMYGVHALMAAARDLGIYPWDVAGIFAANGNPEYMSMADFQAALATWQTQPIS